LSAVVALSPTGPSQPTSARPLSSHVRPHESNSRALRQIAVKLQDVRSYALGLGEVTEEPHHNYSSFRVRGKIFATVPPDEEDIHLFPSEAERERALAMYPEFAQKLLWGGKVVGIRVTLARANTAAVRSLLLLSWQHKEASAPKRKQAGSVSRPPV
jgi:hypothetical protein